MPKEMSRFCELYGSQFHVFPPATPGILLAVTRVPRRLGVDVKPKPGIPLGCDEIHRIHWGFNTFHGDLMGIYGDLMGFYGDLMGIYGDLMGFYDIITGNFRKRLIGGTYHL